MYIAATSHPNTSQRSLFPRVWLVTLLILVAGSSAGAQPLDAPQYLKKLSPAGTRSHLTESWGALEFVLSNPTAADMEARVLTFPASAPGRQYGSDVWVPAKATLKSWLCIGPPASPPDQNVVELRTLLYDRTGGREHLLKSPQGPPLHSDMVRYYRRDAGTTLMLDSDIADGSQEPLSPSDRDRGNAVRNLVRVFRQRAKLSERVDSVKQRFLPPFAEALDGVDHFVLASDRLADDAAGRRTLREWLERGGILWIMLDLVRPETVATILGDDLDVQVVDRVSLTRIQLRAGPAYQHRADVEPTVMETPVDFVRVLAPHLQVHYTVDGWPAAFFKDVGRGRVLFTTLGARGWMRPRTVQDPKSPYSEFPQLPISLVPLEFLVPELHPQPERSPLSTDDLRSYVTEQISYAVVGRRSILLIFGGLFLALATAAISLRRRGWLEHLGWLGPTLAMGAGGVFVGLGAVSRGAVPPTVAVAQIVDAVPGLNEVQTTGFLAVYQPSLSTSPLAAEQGGAFDLDMSGLEGRVHRRVRTDLDRWHWENLDLPAGVRAGPFRYTLRTAEPVEATVRFGPNGAEGRVTAGPFQQLEDVVLVTPGQPALAIRLGADGAFRAGSEDQLPVGQFLVDGLLSDRQRTRQRLYEKLLAEPKPRSLAHRSLLLAWAEPVDMSFHLASEARMTGTALLTIPLRLERTPPGTPVTVPGAFLDCRRITGDGRALQVATESPLATTMRLRFQIPDSVRPLMLERARLALRLNAPGREVVLGAGDVTLRRLSSPQGTQEVILDNPDLLQPDAQGAIFLSVQIGEAPGGSGERSLWRLESAGLELVGRTVAEGNPEKARINPNQER